jgi:hypothetical protein
MCRPLLCALIALSAGLRSDAMTLLDVDFNDGLVPAPSTIIDDTGSGVQVVPSAGNLNDTPLLLTGTAQGLATVAFDFPSFSAGQLVFSWESLVLTLQPEDKDIFGRDQSFIRLLDGTSVPWSLEYDASGQMLLGCCNSSVPMSLTPVGAYVPGQSNHFELSVNLDSDTYSLAVNGEVKVANAALLTGAVNRIGFSSPGRFFTQNPAALAVDNIKVELVPEPSVIAQLFGAIVAIVGIHVRLHVRPGRTQTRAISHRACRGRECHCLQGVLHFRA